MLCLFKQTHGKTSIKCSTLLSSYLVLSDNLWLPGRMQYFVRANGIQTHISAVIYGSLDELLNVLNLIWFYIFMIPQVWILKCSLWLTTVLQPFQMQFRAFNSSLIHCYIPIIHFATILSHTMLTVVPVFAHRKTETNHQKLFRNFFQRVPLRITKIKIVWFESNQRWLWWKWKWSFPYCNSDSSLNQIVMV